jgi:cytochrome c556
MSFCLGLIMQRWIRMVAMGGGMTALLAVSAYAAAPEDGQAAFALRENTMRQMGRALYLGIGRVVKGTAELTPDTVKAADTVVGLAHTLTPLFPVGSDVADSKMKPEIFAAQDRIPQLVAGVEDTAQKLSAAVKSGDKSAIAAAYAVTNNACNACHNQFRKAE